MKRKKSVRRDRVRRTSNRQELTDLEGRPQPGQVSPLTLPIDHRQELEIKSWHAGISVRKLTIAILIVSVVGVMVPVGLEVFKAKSVDTRVRKNEISGQVGSSALSTMSEVPSPVTA